MTLFALSSFLFLMAPTRLVQAFPGEYHPPGPTDQRSPCPALNTLANHGLLPRDGKDVPTADIRFQAEETLATTGIQIAIDVFKDQVRTVNSTKAAFGVLDRGRSAVHSSRRGASKALIMG